MAAAPRRRLTMRSLAITLFAAFALFLITGNAAIAAAWGFARDGQGRAPDPPDQITGISNVRMVDDRLWRGAAPSRQGYRSLSEHGVTTVIDLRAEDDIDVDGAYLRSLGIDLVHIPIRDGQTPTAGEVARFMRAVSGSDGRTFVHCGAGVGRTGTMAAAYLVKTGEASPRQALRRNLSVGPPSLEQLAFVAGLDDGTIDRPNRALVAASRVLDAPRRLWSRLR